MTEKPLKVGTASDGRPMHYSVGIFLENEQDEICLMDRRFKPFGLACPAGHVDEDEVLEGIADAEEIAKRELFEETGIRAHRLQFVCKEEVPWNACWKAEVHYWYLFRYRARSTELKLDPEEAKSGGWRKRASITLDALEPVWKHWFQTMRIQVGS